jgi:catechol 2,3-dioxygenase-like lactoylglutathione lyase family enzyme
MQNLHARSVLFVRDAAQSLAYYTKTLGFSQDWIYEEKGQPYVVQVSLLGMEIILNQTELDDRGRAGQGRVFVGLDEPQAAALMQHARSGGISAAVTHWGAPTVVLSDLDGNELFFWLPDSQRAMLGSQWP